MTGCMGYHDAVGDFSVDVDYGSPGLLSVELKMFSAVGYFAKVHQGKEHALLLPCALQRKLPF